MFLKNHQTINFWFYLFSTLFLRRARQELSNALVGVQFDEILNFLKNHQKINFWLVLGVTGKSRSQPTHPTKMSSFFDGFEPIENVNGHLIL